jgi:dynein heavy chain
VPEQADFEAAMRQKQRLEEDAAATQRKMDSANALLGALAGEEARWTEQSQAFDDRISRLTGAGPPSSMMMSSLYRSGSTSCGAVHPGLPRLQVLLDL